MVELGNAAATVTPDVAVSAWKHLEVSGSHHAVVVCATTEVIFDEEIQQPKESLD